MEITWNLKTTGAKGEPGQGVSSPGPQGVPGSQGEPGRPGSQGEQHHSQQVFFDTIHKLHM